MLPNKEADRPLYIPSK